MGVLNVTPDSFSDGGRFVDLDAAVGAALQMQRDGAALIDVGGESTRPGAEPVPVVEELRRVVPVVRELARQGVLVSVDTSKPEVISAALEAGAHLINDVYGLRQPGALAAAAAGRAAVCVMHMQGEPRSMQHSPRYNNVVAEVADFLRARIEACLAVGITADRLLVDPGFGFGKTAAHNLQLMQGLTELLEIGPPMLVGLSRKSWLATLTGRPVEQRLAGSLALALAAAERGARIIRAHDVPQTVDALKVWAAIGRRQP
ncbi:MAG: dihydropteroate synthase [Sinobacteraceae bacterium]|nr:dihydropteroate synthase [Nevskiaceae bacterium]